MIQLTIGIIPDTTMNMITKLSFRYKLADGRIVNKVYSFRPGDLVRVTDWGEHYGSYTRAFEAFGFGEQENYGYNSSTRLYERPMLFKLVAVLEHEATNDIMCHIRSRAGHNFVISINGLAPVKVYPLRRGEGTLIKINKLAKIQ